jgi:hypothetical protein
LAQVLDRLAPCFERFRDSKWLFRVVKAVLGKKNAFDLLPRCNPLDTTDRSAPIRLNSKEREGEIRLQSY